MPAALENLPCTVLKGVGPRLAEKLKKAGIDSVQAILFHLPFRYQKQRYVRSFDCLQEGDSVILEAKITQVEVKFHPRRTLFCYLSDGKQEFVLRFFHFNEKQKQQFQMHKWVQIRGEVRRVGMHFECIHPAYQFIEGYSDSLPDEGSIFPVYSCEMGFSQALWFRLTSQALSYLTQSSPLSELLPEAFLREQNLPSLMQALFYLHRPPNSADLQALSEGVHPAQKRLIVEELLAHQLIMKKKREYFKADKASPLLARGGLLEAFLQSLPYSLTRAQIRVFEEIQCDLSQSKPMRRLVQGDVGSGKTVVAALAALVAVENRKQVAIMAPTELLAEQHYSFFSRHFLPLGVPVLFLSGKLKGKSRHEVLKQVATVAASVVIGTHALFQEEVVFLDLALSIIDEQHRFGVQQRLALREKAKNCPHQLMMSATPIPRTLAMVTYADLDQSVIDELPPGRQAIQTSVLSQAKRKEIISRVQAQCQKGKQAYWICTLIEESEVLQCKTAKETHRLLQASMPNLRVGLVHGRMAAQEKQAIMTAFRESKIQVLVATTVIEVGVDVPNASLMIIENAERLGLSQLHQLRGRVGRGSVASHCVLLYQHLNGMARERLAIMRGTQDGFLIAKRDLELRGLGDLLGTRQAGEMPFQIANLIRDGALIPLVDSLANDLLKEGDVLPLLLKRWRSQATRYMHA